MVRAVVPRRASDAQQTVDGVVLYAPGSVARIDRSVAITHAGWERLA